MSVCVGGCVCLVDAAGLDVLLMWRSLSQGVAVSSEFAEGLTVWGEK